jgi:hypothetical protein
VLRAGRHWGLAKGGGRRRPKPAKLGPGEAESGRWRQRAARHGLGEAKSGRAMAAGGGGGGHRIGGWPRRRSAGGSVGAGWRRPGRWLRHRRWWGWPWAPIGRRRRRVASVREATGHRR